MARGMIALIAVVCLVGCDQIIARLSATKASDSAPTSPSMAPPITETGPVRQSADSGTPLNSESNATRSESKSNIRSDKVPQASDLALPESFSSALTGGRSFSSGAEMLRSTDSSGLSPSINVEGSNSSIRLDSDTTLIRADRLVND